MTYECKACGIRWYPYMTDAGRCLSCGGGTVRTNESVSANALEHYRKLRARGVAADAYDRFEEFCAQRELRRAAELEALAQLPTRDPEHP